MTNPSNDSQNPSERNRKCIGKLGEKIYFRDPASVNLKPRCLEPQLIMAPAILHIDDDKDLVEGLTARLGHRGFETEGAFNGLSGFKKAEQSVPDLIVLDYDMPGLRGDQVIEELKATPETKHIPIIVLTAVSNSSVKEKLMDRGADVFMKKPFKFEEVHDNIVELLGVDPRETAMVG
ncbi:response regulator [Mariniblastus fucicola]|uniref:Response regulator MprA n=1 Tax=Mariniblastus fucicola TaxID=980251 RepID=A0A5B9PF75_9BACT|nr:response regulator [Mariniblastus fucicola]QEG23845.1 Response regulator MprA [Mariniblastus fucicola]